MFRCIVSLVLAMTSLFWVGCADASEQSSSSQTKSEIEKVKSDVVGGEAQTRNSEKSASDDLQPDCSKQKPLCAAYWTSRAIFVGKVINITTIGKSNQSSKLNRKNTFRPSAAIRFAVQKIYRGSLDEEVAVKVTADNAEQAHDFKLGEVYLVYATARTKDYSSLSIERCNYSKLLSRAEEEIKYIESLPKPAPDVVEVEGGMRTISQPQPSYPEEARKAGIAGSVFVQILIDEDGKVVRAQAMCGSLELVSAAEQAARNWRFVPAYISGKPVKVSTIITFNFLQ